MDHFGLKSVKELPKLKDLHIADNEIGTPSDLMDENEIPVDIDPDAPVDKEGDFPQSEDAVNEGVEATSDATEEGAEFIIEGTVDPEAAMGGSLEQDLIDEEENTETKEE